MLKTDARSSGSGKPCGTVDFVARKRHFDDVMRKIATWFVGCQLANDNATVIASMLRRRMITVVDYRMRDFMTPRYAYTPDGLAYLRGIVNQEQLLWIFRYLSKCVHDQPELHRHYRRVLGDVCREPVDKG